MAKLTLDRERTLTYTWVAVKRLQQEQGISLLALLGGETEWWLDPTVFSAVLWCGLIAEEPDLTIAQVDGLIAFDRLAEITQAMVQAVAGGEQRANPPTRSTASSGSRTVTGSGRGKLTK